MIIEFVLFEKTAKRLFKYKGNENLNISLTSLYLILKVNLNAIEVKYC